MYISLYIYIKVRVIPSDFKRTRNFPKYFSRTFFYCRQLQSYPLPLPKFSRDYHCTPLGTGRWTAGFRRASGGENNKAKARPVYEINPCDDWELYC